MNICKKLLSYMSVIACIAAVVPVGVYADSGNNVIDNGVNYIGEEMQYGDYLSYMQVDQDGDSKADYIEISSCDKNVEEIEIPAEINNLPVSSIGELAFYDCWALTNVTIPDSIISISSVAFTECKNLESVTISEGVVSIGEGAFSGCISLVDINIPKSVTDIGAGAFNDTLWLEGKKAENPLVVVNSILIDGSACSGKVTIPSTVTSIAPLAFSECSDITSVTIPNSVKTIGEMAFDSCVSLESIKIGKGIEELTGGVFVNCESLTEVTIPQNITSIHEMAFCGCINLEKITIPKSVTYIGDMAFGETQWIYDQREINPYVVVNSILIDARDISGDIVIPDTVNYVGDWVFFARNDIESVTFSESVKTIGNGAFALSSVTEVNIPDTVETIGNTAFTECTELEKFTIGSGVKNIGESVCVCCLALTDVTFPENITAIPYEMFRGCTALEKIIIPESVESIGMYAFFECSSLNDITIMNPHCKIYDSEDTICNECDIDNDECTFDGTIYSTENSDAKLYADKYGYKFELISNKVKGEILRGDVDGNGKVDLQDCISIAKHLIKIVTLDDDEMERADYNDNGSVDLQDAIGIAKYLLNKN